MTEKTTKTEIKVDMKPKEILLYREGLIQSIIADTYTFGLIFGGLFLNQYYLGGKTYIGMFFLIIFFIMTVVKASNKKRTFTSKKKLQEYVNNL